MFSSRFGGLSPTLRPSKCYALDFKRKSCRKIFSQLHHLSISIAPPEPSRPQPRPTAKLVKSTVLQIAERCGLCEASLLVDGSSALVRIARGNQVFPAFDTILAIDGPTSSQIVSLIETRYSRVRRIPHRGAIRACWPRHRSSGPKPRAADAFERSSSAMPAYFGLPRLRLTAKVTSYRQTNIAL